MAQKKIILLPRVAQLLKTLGEDIRLARLRRNVSAKLTAERAGISLATLAKIEAGAPTVAIGNYMLVLWTLGMEQNLADIAKDDELGRKLLELGLRERKRASKRTMT